MTVIETPLLNYQDLVEQFPDDGLRREIIEGVLHVSAAPASPHQWLSMELIKLLLSAVDGTGWGRVFHAPIDVVFTEMNAVQPDIIVIRSDRLQIYDENPIREAPDVVIEILSPSTRRYDEVEKLAVYARFGVPEVWLADPEGRTLRMLRWEDGAYTVVEPSAGRLTSPTVPGLTIDSAALFTGIRRLGDRSEG